MSATAFVPKGYQLETVNGRRILVPDRPESWNTRLAGHQTSRRVWLCKKCWTWHEARRPALCINAACQGLKFFHFDSAGEARYFVGLVRQLEAGSISELIHHPTYKIFIEGPRGARTHVFNYVADAEYRDSDGTVVTADFKPRLNVRARTKAKREAMLDPVFKLKRTCFEAQYGRPVTIVTEA